MKKSGFTIIEILVVIAIIWIISLLAVNFDFNKKWSIEKSWRVINKISSLLKTEFFNSQAWKWVEFWSWIIIPDYREILWNTWKITIKYVWAKTLTWEIFSAPFFWESLYEIKSINYELKDSSTWVVNYPFSLIITNWNTSFSGISLPSSAVKLNITAWYKPFYKTLKLDRRTWTVEITK